MFYKIFDIYILHPRFPVLYPETVSSRIRKFSKRSVKSGCLHSDIYVSKKTNSLNDNYPNTNSNVLYPLSIIAKSKGFRIASLNVNSLLKLTMRFE